MRNLTYGKMGNEEKHCPNCGQAFDWDQVFDDELKVKNEFLNRHF